jgi:hypothetical protein
MKKDDSDREFIGLNMQHSKRFRLTTKLKLRYKIFV